MSKKNKDKLYCYAKPNQMVNHQFSDDVAICWAKNKQQALNKFHYLYKYCFLEDIFEIKYIPSVGVAILTDY